MSVTFIKKLNWRGDARLYKLSEFFAYESNDEGVSTTDHIIVSGVDNEYATETYVFPATADGTELSMLEMAGSFKGSVDHQRAIDGFLAEAIPA